MSPAHPVRSLGLIATLWLTISTGSHAGENLLANPSGTSGATDGWTIIAAGGDGWASRPLSADGDGSSFITSYGWCTRSQTIDLLAAGFSESFLDRSPPLFVTESFRGTQNVADLYYLRVELRDENGVVLDSWNVGSQAEGVVADGSWRTEQHTFENYPAGVREIYWEDGGNDAEFWAGHYGTLLDAAELSFIDPAPTGIDLIPGTYPVGAVAGGAAGVLTAEDTPGSTHEFALVSVTGDSPLVSTGALWSFLDDGTDQGAAWRESDFDDSAWPSGNAELGYGEGDEAIPLLGQGAHFTNYFRHRFNVSAAQLAEVVSLTLRLKRDDGAVVYLNGTEIARDNLPAAPAVIAFDTPAPVAAGDDGQTFHPFTVPLGLLVEGENVLAAEIHQANLTSSDASFDLELSAETIDDDFDNALFTIDGDRLLFAQSGPSVPVTVGASWSVNVRATDDAGNTLDEVLLVTGVANPTQPPTGIALSPSFVTERSPVGTIVGTLTATDADPGDLHSFTLVTGAGDTDNALFEINSGRLATAAEFDSIAQPTATVRVRATDRIGLTFEQSLTVEVRDLNDVPTDIAFTGTSATVGIPAGTLIGTLATTDADLGDTHAYTLVPIDGSQPVFDFGSEWRFLDDGSNLDDLGWTDPRSAFDDSGWKIGTGSFGYGDAQTTTVDFGPDPDNKHITTYFRRTFTIDDPAAYAGYELQILRDDGVAVYLNTEPVARDGLLDGAGALDLATATIGAADETTPLIVPLDPIELVAGENTIAAEIHQAAAGSSDLTFDLALAGTGDVSGAAHFEIVNGNEVRTSQPLSGVTPGTVLPLLVRSDDGRGGTIERSFEIDIFSDNADDRDGDGLSDAWELQYFADISAQDGAGDPDRDGLTNTDEFVFDTDPTDSASRMTLSILPFGPTTHTIQWPSSTARNYRLQSSETLEAGSWTDTAGGVRQGTGATVTEFAPLSGAATRHYRVLVEIR